MTMKRFFGMLTAMVMTSLTFTSCYDEDVETSITLSGDWCGYFGMYYVYVDRHGHETPYDSYKTDISFYPDYDYATHGYGYEVDYYGVDSPYRKIYHSFDWDIRNGNIYLTYNDEREYDTVIRDYRMDEYLFTGYFDKGTTRFRLEKYGYYYDWNPYWDEWGYDGWHYYGSTINTRADGETSEAGAEPEGGTILRFGNRFEDAK